MSSIDTDAPEQRRQSAAEAPPRGTVVLVRGVGETFPAVVVQPALLGALDSVLVVPLGRAADAPDTPMLRPQVDAGGEALGEAMVAMPEVIVAVPRATLSAAIWTLPAHDLRALDRALLLTLGLA